MKKQITIKGSGNDTIEIDVRIIDYDHSYNALKLNENEFLDFLYLLMLFHERNF